MPRHSGSDSFAVPMLKYLKIWTESQFTISPSNLSAILSASSLFPDPVGPTTAINGCVTPNDASSRFPDGGNEFIFGYALNNDDNKPGASRNGYCFLRGSAQR